MSPQPAQSPVEVALVPWSGQGSATHPATGTVTSEGCRITTGFPGGGNRGGSRLCYPSTLPASRSRGSVSTPPYFLSPGGASAITSLKSKTQQNPCTALWILNHFGRWAPSGTGLRGTLANLSAMQMGLFSCQISQY